MFFPRLRRQAKWAFAVMILVFGVGFVLLGVGSGGLDLGSLLQDSFGRGSSGTSISKAEKKVDENPRNAAAQKELATAYETKGRTQDAIATYQQYVALRPKDVDALTHLAALQRSQADTYLAQAQLAFYEQSSATARSTFGASPTSTFGRALGQDPIATAVQQKTSTAAQQASSQYQTAAQAAVAAYQKLAELQPTQENLLALGDVAGHFGDTTTAVKAYRQLLKKTNDPAITQQIRAQIKALQSRGGG
jgi:tetratricopeptide (TPR) repeat protein